MKHFSGDCQGEAPEWSNVQRTCTSALQPFGAGLGVGGSTSNSLTLSECELVHLIKKFLAIWHFGGSEKQDFNTILFLT